MATTADILGLNGRRAVPRRWTDHYERLCLERDRLLDRDCSAFEIGVTKMDDLADAGSDEALRDMSLVSAEVTNASIHEVLDAIRRIERGTYGICEITGRPIEEERLLAIPWTRCSYAGQDELEKGGHARRARLPGLTAVNEPDVANGDAGEKEEVA